MGAGADDPFQTLARGDNASLRRKVFGWAFVMLAVLAGGIFFFVRAITRTLDQEAVPSSYLEAVQQKRFGAAYDLLCDDLQSRISRTDFRSDSLHDALAGVELDGVGSRVPFGEKRGPFRLVSYSYLVSGPELPEGTRVSVLLQVTGETESCIYSLETREVPRPTS